MNLKETTLRELTVEETLMVSGGQIVNPFGVDHVNDPAPQPPPPPPGNNWVPGMMR